MNKLAIFLAVILAAFASGPLQSDLQCGDLLTENTTLDGNLDCDALSSGIAIGADGLTLDLNGYTISCTGAQYGDSSSGVWIDGREGVTVTNGAIRGCQDGIVAVAGSDHLSLSRLSISGQVSAAIFISESHEAGIRQVVINQPPGNTAEPAEAIRLVNSDGVEIRDITVDGGVFGVLSMGGPAGFPAHVSQRLKIMDSTFSNVAFGIRIIRHAHLMIRDNRIFGANQGDGCGAGIQFVGDEEPERDPISLAAVFENKVSGCDFGIHVDTAAPSTGFLVVRNDLTVNADGLHFRNLQDSLIIANRMHFNAAGLALVGNTRNNRIQANQSTGNADFDMYHEPGSTPNTWTGNTCETASGNDIDCM